MKPLFYLVICAMLTTSCSKYSIFGGKLGGTQSPIGETTNNFSTSSVTGVTSISGKITSLEDGVTSMTLSTELSDPKFIELAGGVSDGKLTGKVLTRERKYRFTSEGIESVYDEGNLILVKYSDEVGDEHSLKKGNQTIKRKVTTKSTTDDYSYGFMLIKAMTVEETGKNVPGLSKIQYIANHRFGLVGMKFFFEDGTTKNIAIYSDKTNE